MTRQDDTESMLGRPEAIPILVVEDNDADARYVREVLREDASQQYEVTRVKLLDDARRRLVESPAACVLLDLRLPDANWLDALLDLRAASSEVPIVIFSGLEDEELAVRAVQEGAQDYLLKGNVDGGLLARSLKYAIERKRHEVRLAQLALRDPLTGLANRTLFLDRLKHALARVERARSPIALLVLDLDDFKPINDTFGHAAGDLVLVELAARLRRETRRNDTVARFGGDEFTILLEDIADDEGALSAVDRIEEALSEPFAVAEASVLVASSIGIATASSSDVPPEELLRDADLAMYRAKEKAKLSRALLGTAVDQRGNGRPYVA